MSKLYRYCSVRTVNFVLALILLTMLVAFRGQISRRIEFWRTETVTIDGLTYHLNPDDMVITRVILRNGYWEPKEVEFLKSSLQSGDTFIDVGANFGWYTVMASKRVGPRGRVVAFEPDPISFALLRKNVEANGCTNVIIEQKALSNAVTTLELFIDEENKGAHRTHHFAGAVGAVKVEAIPLDLYLREKNWWDIDFIKIDTEGAEGIILEGMSETLERCPTVTLILEYFPKLLHEAGYDPRRLLDRLDSAGFQIKHLLSSSSTRLLSIDRVPSRLAELELDGHGEFVNIILSRPVGDPKNQP